MNNEVALSRGSTHVFIVWWDVRAPYDQTNLTKGRAASRQAVEEACGRGGPKP